MEGNMYDNYVFDLYGTLVDIHTEEMMLRYGKTESVLRILWSFI